MIEHPITEALAERAGTSDGDAYDFQIEVIAEIETLRRQIVQARADRADLLDTVAQFLRGECTCVRQYQEDVEGLQHFPGCPVVMQRQLAEVTEQRDELAETAKRLRSVMGAAATEIEDHWDAHCDEDGYGPVNLLHRLRFGIAEMYPAYYPDNTAAPLDVAALAQLNGEEGK